MRNRIERILIGSVLVWSTVLLHSQIYSPKVMLQDQLDTTNLKSLAQGIYRNAHAVTDREKAESIWRFYLTNGRFVKPGMFYHIPGWAYEEPLGEVLDPIKLLNSYGFGLCYQDAPLLQATWDAGGFKHTRVWFLTGHTVAEVFYDGNFHYYDSDMMGYTTVGNGPLKTSAVASVQQLAADRSILLGKLQGERMAKPGAVDDPWYPADVREGAIKDLADVFSSSDDNYLYSNTRYSHGHTMDFVLRPGERMIRYYNQPDSAIRYMPYKTDGKSRQEFPKDVGRILLVKNGPLSEKDTRRWSTGLIEYQPSLKAVQAAQKANQAVFAMPSPYVIIGANFSMNVSLATGERFMVETSTDAGHTWTLASNLNGPFSGISKVEPATVARSSHGTLNAVAGTYGYLVRLTLNSSSDDLNKSVTDVKLSTVFEFNPRTLPGIAPGTNLINYETADAIRNELPIRASEAQAFAEKFSNAMYTSEGGQGYLQNTGGKVGEMIFKLSGDGAESLTGFDVGGRFLDLQDGLAPDKLTAEVRKVTPWPAKAGTPKAASIAWSLNTAGPWTTIWTLEPNIAWPDGHPVKQIIRWPEVDRSVRDLKTGSSNVYVRYQFQSLAVDDIRLATIQRAMPNSSKLTVTHRWSENGKPAEFTEVIDGSSAKTYRFDIPRDSAIQNQALILSAQ